MYNRDLIADLFKIAYTVLSDAKYDVKVGIDCRANAMEILFALCRDRPNVRRARRRARQRMPLVISTTSN